MTNNIHPVILSALNNWTEGVGCDEEELDLLVAVGILDYRDEVPAEHIIAERIQDILYNNPQKLSYLPTEQKPELILKIENRSAALQTISTDYTLLAGKIDEYETDWQEGDEYLAEWSYYIHIRPLTNFVLIKYIYTDTANPRFNKKQLHFFIRSKWFKINIP